MKMIERAWNWAKAKGKVRTNDVHGEEEIKIILSETFDINSAEIEEAEWFHRAAQGCPSRQ